MDRSNVTVFWGIAFAIVTAMAPAAASGAPGFGGGTEVRRDTLKVPTRTRWSKRRMKQEMAQLGTPKIPGLRQWEREKSPRVAMLSNMLLPGLGQLYNGRRLKTVIMVGVGTFYFGKVMLENRRKLAHRKSRERLPTNTLEWRFEDALYQFHRENTRDYIWFSGAAWLIGALDAFVDAHLFDVRSVDPTIFHTSNKSYMGLSVRF